MFQTPMLVSFVLAGSTFVTAVSQPVFISFNETLAGFDDFGGEIDDSIAVFDAAYMVRLLHLMVATGPTSTSLSPPRALITVPCMRNLDSK